MNETNDLGHPLLPLTTRPQTSKNASVVDSNTLENGLTTNTSSSNHKKKWKEHPENERDAGSTKCCCGLVRFRGLTSLEKCLCLALASCLAILVIFILLTCIGFLRSNGSDKIYHSPYSSNSYIQTKGNECITTHCI